MDAFKIFMGIIIGLALSSCNPEDPMVVSNPVSPNNPVLLNKNIQYLALGDSYTIGQSVCENCRFPAQLAKELKSINQANTTLKIIAQTGWTTSNLKRAIAEQKPDSKYDLVTLLIGVNNQYQGQNFSVYQKEFPELMETAIQLANGNPNRVVVLSIPDYAFTPFGQNLTVPQKVSTEIDVYNAFAKETAENRKVTFLNITDITRLGLLFPSYVASDNLHPSEVAYAEFVKKLQPIVVEKLK